MRSSPQEVLRDDCRVERTGIACGDSSGRPQRNYPAQEQKRLLSLFEVSGNRKAVLPGPRNTGLNALVLGEEVPGQGGSGAVVEILADAIKDRSDRWATGTGCSDIESCCPYRGVPRARPALDSRVADRGCSHDSPASA